jgi:TPR repeat protein
MDTVGGRIGRLLLLVAGIASAAPPLQACAMFRYRGPQPSPPAESQGVFDQAAEAEKTDPRKAVSLYLRAVKMKNGFAAIRLSEIYDQGLPGVQRDYGKSLEWAQAAQRLGYKMWEGGACGPGR